MELKGLRAKIWNPVFSQIDLKSATIKLKDGGANELEVKIGEGNLTYAEARNLIYTLNRGLLDDVRLGDEVPITVSFDFVWEYLKGPSSASTISGGTPTIEDVLKQRGPAAVWVSTDADTCRPFAIDIEILWEPTPTSCGDKESIVLQDFRYESLDHDLRGAAVACSGQCNVTDAAVSRTPQS